MAKWGGNPNVDVGRPNVFGRSQRGDVDILLAWQANGTGRLD